jgi:hypothetical protein
MIEDNLSASRAIILLTSTATEDDMLLAHIREAAIQPSIVAQLSGVVEAVYAHRDVASANTMDVAAELSVYAAGNGWTRLRDVGPRIAKALWRDAGKKGDWPKASTDPEVAPRFKPDEPAAGPGEKK